MQKTLDKRISQIEQSMIGGNTTLSMESALEAMAALTDRLKQIFSEDEYHAAIWWVTDGYASYPLVKDKQGLKKLRLEEQEPVKKIMSDPEAKELLRKFFIESLVWMGDTEREARERLSTRQWDYNPIAARLKENET